MDQQFAQAIDDMIIDCLASPSLSSLTPDQKQSITEQIRNYLYTQTLFTIIDNLNDDQFQQIQGLDPQDPQMQQKIEEFTAEMPFLLNDIEDKLKQGVEYIKLNGQIPSQEEQLAD